MSFWCLQFSQKMNENNLTWGTIVCSKVELFFVGFLGELKIPKRHFEINWPLPTKVSFTWSKIKTKKKHIYLITIAFEFIFDTKFQRFAAPFCPQEEGRVGVSGGLRGRNGGRKTFDRIQYTLHWDLFFDEQLHEGLNHSHMCALKKKKKNWLNGQ